MTRPIEAQIDCRALENNLKILRERSAAPFVWGIVKANAYGHGLDFLLESFAKTVDGLAVLDVDEAIRIKNLGWNKHVLLIEGFFYEAEALEAVRNGVETIVHSYWQIDDLKKLHWPKDSELSVYIKLNSGMNRLGFNPEEIAKVRELLAEIPQVKVLGIVTHFANSEDLTDNDSIVTVRKQLAEVEKVRGDLPLCLCNSGGILWHKEAVHEAVRAGIAMYGVSPTDLISEEELGIKPVMALKAGIIAIRTVKPGDQIGYGSRFTAEREMRVGVLACGYADGYPRVSGGKAWVGVNGKKCKVLGSVSMDMISVDLTDVPEAGVGDTAELWGTFPTVNQVASWVGTIGYELLTKVTPRVTRRYLR